MNLSVTRSETSPPLPDLRDALSRACEALVSCQRHDGSWCRDTDLGPIGLSTQLLVEKLFGALPADDAPLALAYYERRQRADGSFEPFPHAGRGCPATTALCWAALVACDHEHSGVARRALTFVREHGGLELSARLFRERGEVAGLYLLAHGHLGPDFLPHLPPGVALAPLGTMLDRRVHAGNIMMMLVLAALVERHRPAPRGLFGQARVAVEQLRIRQYLLSWQNADGSWNGSPLQTTMMLLGLHAAGATASDPPIHRALDWLDTMKRRGDELDACAMDNDVWSTALCALAIHEGAGFAEDAPSLHEASKRATDYLLSVQCREPMPKENQRKPGAQRTGGWPFQRGNETMPDTDDTGVVVATLATLAGQRAPRRLFASIDQGVSWLRDMQNPDGGFPTFVWGLPSKEPGPMFMADLPMDLDNPKALVESFVRPQAEYGDPSLAGVTGRVLWGLGVSGVGRNDPAVCRAVAFLRAQQCETGAWWGRWKACYLAETATVLLGLGAVGEDMTADYISRARRWVLDCQNDDGGFGETADAYRDPSLAGRGPSMPAVTAYVLLGCLATGDPPRDAMVRAGRYLLNAQRPDGLWDNAGWLHTFVPPRLLYVYDVPAQALPVVALAELERWATR